MRKQQENWFVEEKGYKEVSNRKPRENEFA